MEQERQNRMFKIVKNINHRLQDTGYETLDLTHLAQHLQEKPYLGFYCKPVTDLAKDKSPNGVLVFYMEPQPDKSSISNKSIISLVSVSANLKPSTLLVILDGNLSHIAKKQLYEQVTDDIVRKTRLVVFQAEELLFNPTKHKLVSKHVVLSKEEEKKWLEETGLLKSQLPRIGSEDIQIRWQDAVPGDIVRVEGRPSPTVGSTVSHYLVAYLEAK